MGIAKHTASAATVETSALTVAMKHDTQHNIDK